MHSGFWPRVLASNIKINKNHYACITFAWITKQSDLVSAPKNKFRGKGRLEKFRNLRSDAEKVETRTELFIQLKNSVFLRCAIFLRMPLQKYERAHWTLLKKNKLRSHWPKLSVSFNPSGISKSSVLITSVSIFSYFYSKHKDPLIFPDKR